MTVSLLAYFILLGELRQPLINLFNHRMYPIIPQPLQSGKFLAKILRHNPLAQTQLLIMTSFMTKEWFSGKTFTLALMSLPPCSFHMTIKFHYQIPSYYKTRTSTCFGIIYLQRIVFICSYYFGMTSHLV